jgi:hypothetical protein
MAKRLRNQCDHRLGKRELAAMDKFRTFCLDRCRLATDGEAEGLLADEDWKSLSIGFFVALGLTVEVAFDLSLHARYCRQYWMDDHAELPA